MSSNFVSKASSTEQHLKRWESELIVQIPTSLRLLIDHFRLVLSLLLLFCSSIFQICILHRGCQNVWNCFVDEFNLHQLLILKKIQKFKKKKKNIQTNLID